MPALRNTRHEKFAQHAAEGMDNGEAYRKVYPKAESRSALSAGTRLFKIVENRIREIQRQAKGKALLTNAKRREIMAGFANDPKLTAAVRMQALMNDAKLSGEFTDSGTTVTVGVSVNNNLTEERRKELMQKKRAAIEWQRAAVKPLSLNGANGHNGHS